MHHAPCPSYSTRRGTSEYSTYSCMEYLPTVPAVGIQPRTRTSSCTLHRYTLTANVKSACVRCTLTVVRYTLSQQMPRRGSVGSYGTKYLLVQQWFLVCPTRHEGWPSIDKRIPILCSAVLTSEARRRVAGLRGAFGVPGSVPLYVPHQAQSSCGHLPSRVCC